MRKIEKTVLLGAFFLLNSAQALAQDVLDDISTYWGNFDIAPLYSDYSVFIDFLVFLVLFTGISQVVFKDRFKERAGKAVIIAMGVAFSISLAVFESAYNFNIAMIGPLAMGIFLMLIGIFLYKMLVDTMGIPKTGAASMVFIVVYFFSKAAIPQLYDWMSDNMAIVSALLAILLPFAVVRSIMALWRIAWPKKEKVEEEAGYEEKEADKESKKEEESTDEDETDESGRKRKRKSLRRIRLEKLLKGLSVEVSRYRAMVDGYERLTLDLISKLDRLFSTGSSYFEPDSIDFDWPAYRRLVKSIDRQEKKILRMLQAVDKSREWQGTVFEKPIKKLILAFEDSLGKREKAKKMLDDKYAGKIEI